VEVDLDRGRVTAIRFSTPYYRTMSGFGVRSRIPLGPCHRASPRPLRAPLAWVRLERAGAGNAVQLLGQVGRGPRSLPATSRNFLKPWFFIDVHQDRASGFYFALTFID
jgi:hypothetical protein